MKFTSASKRYNGYTLIELSVVLLVLSLMLGGILSIVTQNARLEKRAQLDRQLARIQAALLEYRKANNRLPCPGNLGIAITDSNFGREAANTGSCSGGTPAANYDDIAGDMKAGSLPVRTLGLPDEYAVDPWGGRFVYAVTKRMTRSTAQNPFAQYGINSSTAGVIKISDLDGTTITSTAVYMVLSHGPNGHGAYNINGNRKYTGTTYAPELMNCRCNDDGGMGAVLVTNEYRQARETGDSASGLNQFDDVVVYAMRQDLLIASEVLTESK